MTTSQDISIKTSPLISCSELLAQLGHAGLVIIDCRFDLAEPQANIAEYQKNHIPGARYAHLDLDLSAPIGDGKLGRHPLPAPKQFIEKLQSWGIDQYSSVVVYDHSSCAMAAARAWWLLKHYGIDNVRVLEGGLKQWQACNYPLDNKIPTIIRSNCAGVSPDDTMLVEMPQILQQIENQQNELLLVDARTAERYRGEVEPLGPIAGHIPGAKNRPFPDNLDQDGLFKTAEDLSTAFNQLLDSEKTAVFYCGSGVTACHNILASQIAGLPMPKLYNGSWSQWTKIENTPIETS
ncbi:sulfurtransferase [Pelagibaculum spongiae]|nr:sulfurtransferase [Pelagibaculum spongiae]